MKSFLLGLFVGAFMVKATEDMIMPRLENGWDMVDQQRVTYCRERSRKWYRKVTFQVRNTYERCIRHEI